METMNELLTKLNACKEAKDWASGKTFEEVYSMCHRGDWLCWLFAKTNPEDVQLLTLVKGHQANTVRDLMQDERSRMAVDTAIAFGEGRATEEELSRAADAADSAVRATVWSSYAAWAAAARDASYASDAAELAARAAVRSAEADFAARAAVYAAEQANQQQTADIFRKYISIAKFKI